MLNQDFKLHPSMQYLFLLTVVVIASFGIVALLPATGWLKIAAFVLLAVYSLNLFYHTALLRGSSVITGLRRLNTGKWMLTIGGEEKEAELLGDSVATAIITVLRFRLSDKRWPVSCVIFRDSLPKDDYRQLVVLLKS